MVTWAHICKFLLREKKNFPLSKCYLLISFYLRKTLTHLQLGKSLFKLPKQLTPRWPMRQHMSSPERSLLPPLSQNIIAVQLSPCHTYPHAVCLRCWEQKVLRSNELPWLFSGEESENKHFPQQLDIREARGRLAAWQVGTLLEWNTLVACGPTLAVKDSLSKSS